MSLTAHIAPLIAAAGTLRDYESPVTRNVHFPCLRNFFKVLGPLRLFRKTVARPNCRCIHYEAFCYVGPPKICVVATAD